MQRSSERGRGFPWWGLGLASLGLIALLLRLWRLGAINELVFDEVYYVEFAVDYLQGQAVFDAHPPLGKYLIAIAIALAHPWAEGLNWPQNAAVGVELSPISYRWLNAVVGATLPVLVGLLARNLLPEAPSLGRRFGLLAGGLMLLEGFTLVESRLALINIYWVVFGGLGQLGLMLPGWGWRLLGGVALGAAISVKWNGAGFCLGVWILWGLGRWRSELQAVPLVRLRPWELLLYGLVVPALVYLLLWIPHLQLNPTGLVDLHRQLWQVHQSIANQADAHPYCSRWYTWPLMLRPLAYFYEQGSAPTGTVAITDIHGMGNPLGWWLATAAIVALAAQVATHRHRKSGSLPAVPTYLLVNFGANWLPWIAVQRCTFLYLYLGSLVFAQMALAWLLARWLDQRQPFPVYLLLTLMVTGFLFWLPIFVGLPLEGSGFGRRMWLPTWI